MNFQPFKVNPDQVVHLVRQALPRITEAHLRVDGNRKAGFFVYEIDKARMGTVPVALWMLSSESVASALIVHLKAAGLDAPAPTPAPAPLPPRAKRWAR